MRAESMLNFILHNHVNPAQQRAQSTLEPWVIPVTPFGTIDIRWPTGDKFRPQITISYQNPLARSKYGKVQINLRIKEGTAVIMHSGTNQRKDTGEPYRFSSKAQASFVKKSRMVLRYELQGKAQFNGDVSTYGGIWTFTATPKLLHGMGNKGRIYYTSNSHSANKLFKLPTAAVLEIRMIRKSSQPTFMLVASGSYGEHTLKDYVLGAEGRSGEGGRYQYAGTGGGEVLVNLTSEGKILIVMSPTRIIYDQISRDWTLNTMEEDTLKNRAFAVKMDAYKLLAKINGTLTNGQAKPQMQRALRHFKSVSRRMQNFIEYAVTTDSCNNLWFSSVERMLQLVLNIDSFLSTIECYGRRAPFASECRRLEATLYRNGISFPLNSRGEVCIKAQASTCEAFKVQGQQNEITRRMIEDVVSEDSRRTVVNIMAAAKTRLSAAR